MTAACNQVVRGKLEELAQWCAEQRMAWVREANKGREPRTAWAKASSYSAMETRIRAEIKRLGR